MRNTSSMNAAGRLAAIALVTLGGCSTLAADPAAPGASAAPAAQTPRTEQPVPAPHPPVADPSAAPARRAPLARSTPAVRPLPAEAAPAEKLPPNDLTPQMLFQLLASEIAAQRGQVGSAAATYLSLAQQTHDPRLARRATELALAERSLDRALQASKLWREFAPESTLAAQTLESLWLSVGDYADAEPLVAQRLARARADKAVDEFYKQIARTLLRAPDKPGALAMLDRVAKGDPDHPEARLALAAVAHGAGDHDRATAEAVAASRLRPDDERAIVHAARFASETAGGAAAAAGLLERFLERNPKSTEARFQYARLLASQGRTDAARTQMELALRGAPDNPPILFSLAQIAYQTKQLPVAEDYLNRYLRLPASVPRDNGPAHLFLAQIEEDRGRIEQAVAQLANVTRGDQLLPAVTRRALLLGRLGRIDEAREALRGTSVPTTAERTQLILAEAQVLREAQRFADAFEVLDQALERAPDSVDLLYDHAMAAERIDRVPVMEKSLRRLIELRPDNSHAYNALGYTFADRNMRLDEAQALIEKALTLAPDDAHIIDSMGWVLFRRGRLEEALAWLERAFKAKPDVEIAAHLGEVLWQMGRQADARKVWAEAKGREPGNTILRETLARLNVAL